MPLSSVPPRNVFGEITNAKNRDASTVIAIEPRTKRFGFACMQAGELLDWGLQVIRVKSRSEHVIAARVAGLLEKYSPDVVVLPLVGVGGDYRGQRVIALVEAISREAARRGIAVQRLAAQTVQDRFAKRYGSRLRNKTELRLLVTSQFPELQAYALRTRRTWDSEQHYAPLFAAVAMAIAWRLERL